MKTKTIFSMLIIALFAFVSCSKNDVPPGNRDTKSFYIQIRKASEKSRAEGADMSDQEVNFSDGYLIFTTADDIGRVIRIVASNAGDKQVLVSQLEAGVEIENIPASTTHVYLYGNLGESLSGIAAAAIEGGSISTVEALTWGLGDIQNETNDVAKVPVYGKGDVAPGEEETDRLESRFDVYPVASRLQIGEISCSDDERVTKLTLSGIYINGFYHSMDADNTFLDTYLVDNGIDMTKYPATGYEDYPTMSDVGLATDLMDEAATPTLTDGYWAYNFFPATMPHIVLHFTELEVGGEAVSGNKYATVSRYSTSPEGGEENVFTTALAGYVYTLNIDITDYEQQLSDRPESSSSVIGYVIINIIDWQGVTLYPEW
ncbi:hypothetical protein M2480_000599 [Parabacteroides sp. PFB2-12]|uniref:hypothetical protein n=2 Tax=unclassified Parabacteroides TaxID=2649774 RepID=UPI002474F68B|nr:hypothetical protein [Parabacteroides sp. PM6-13]MDH6341936.1 hypothetical protein [Parabacteroides sp. PM6-13]MDH6389634.1 hypothetical protein [Parabacteroides sp. PFB2-12]